MEQYLILHTCFPGMMMALSWMWRIDSIRYQHYYNSYCLKLQTCIIKMVSWCACMLSIFTGGVWEHSDWRRSIKSIYWRTVSWILWSSFLQEQTEGKWSTMGLMLQCQCHQSTYSQEVLDWEKAAMKFKRQWVARMPIKRGNWIVSSFTTFSQRPLAQAHYGCCSKPPAAFDNPLWNQSSL